MNATEFVLIKQALQKHGCEAELAALHAIGSSLSRVTSERDEFAKVLSVGKGEETYRKLKAERDTALAQLKEAREQAHEQLEKQIQYTGTVCDRLAETSAKLRAALSELQLLKGGDAPCIANTDSSGTSAQPAKSSSTQAIVSGGAGEVRPSPSAEQTPPAIHIKVDSTLSDDDSDEIVLHQMPDGRLFLEIYQGPGLGTQHTQTTLDPEAIDALVQFIGYRSRVDYGLVPEPSPSAELNLKAMALHGVAAAAWIEANSSTDPHDPDEAAAIIATHFEPLVTAAHAQIERLRAEREEYAERYHKALTQAFNDPGDFTPREFSSPPESLSEWQARAMKIARAALAQEPAQSGPDRMSTEQQ